jgi:hypothetical protein
MRVLRLGPVVDQAVLQREVIRSISGTGWDRCGIGVLILGLMGDAAAPDRDACAHGCADAAGDATIGAGGVGGWRDLGS